MIGPTDLLNPSPAQHFETFQVFLNCCPKRPSFSTIQSHAPNVACYYIYTVKTELSTSEYINSSTHRNIRHLEHNLKTDDWNWLKITFDRGTVVWTAILYYPLAFQFVSSLTLAQYLFTLRDIFPINLLKPTGYVMHLQV